MNVFQGCELCGDWPAHLHSRCHPTAPVRIEIEESGYLKIYCYVPECNRLVARIRIHESERLSAADHQKIMLDIMTTPADIDEGE